MFAFWGMLLLLLLAFSKLGPLLPCRCRQCRLIGVLTEGPRVLNRIYDMKRCHGRMGREGGKMWETKWRNPTLLYSTLLYCARCFMLCCVLCYILETLRKNDEKYILFFACVCNSISRWYIWCVFPSAFMWLSLPWPSKLVTWLDSRMSFLIAASNASTCCGSLGGFLESAVFEWECLMTLSYLCIIDSLICRSRSPLCLFCHSWRRGEVNGPAWLGVPPFLRFGLVKSPPPINFITSKQSQNWIRFRNRQRNEDTINNCWMTGFPSDYWE